MLKFNWLHPKQVKLTKPPLIGHSPLRPIHVLNQTNTYEATFRFHNDR